MIDFLADHPKVAVGTIALAALGMFGVHSLVSRHNDKMHSMIMEVRPL